MAKEGFEFIVGFVCFSYSCVFKRCLDRKPQFPCTECRIVQPTAALPPTPLGKAIVFLIRNVIFYDDSVLKHVSILSRSIDATGLDQYSSSPWLFLTIVIRGEEIRFGTAHFPVSFNRPKQAWYHCKLLRQWLCVNNSLRKGWYDYYKLLSTNHRKTILADTGGPNTSRIFWIMSTVVECGPQWMTLVEMMEARPIRCFKTSKR